MYSSIDIASKVQTIKPQQQLQQKKALTLPPNVNGRRRGTLEIRLSATDGIRWKSAKSYPAVEVRVLWWGQQEQLLGSAAVLHWEQGKARSSSTVQFEILTSEELFRNYLRAAEPVQVRLISSRTNSLIGTGSIAIPGKIVNFRNDSGRSSVEATGRGEIYSQRRFSLGEISVDFCLKFEDYVRERVTKDNGEKISMVQDCRKRTAPLVPERDVGVELAIKGDPVVLHESNERKQPPKTFRSLESKSRDKVLNYLLGKDLSGSEDEPLSEICSISPTESMMDALNRFDTASVPKKAEYLRIVNSARMVVETLKFTKAGLKELFHKTRQSSLADATFLVKVKIPSPQNVGSKVTLRSLSVSECGEVTFNAKAMTKLVIPKNYGNLQFEFMVYITNQTSFHQRGSTKEAFLGSSTIKIEELVKNRFACYKRCPVRLASDDISLGMLTIRLELGSRGLHFGKELIDAVLVDKENVTISSSSSSESEINHPQPCWAFRPPPTECHRMLSTRSYFDCLPRTCTQDEGNTGGENNTNNLPVHQGSSHQAPAAGLNNPLKDQETSPDRGPKAMDTHEDTQEMTKKLLHGVLHLGQLKDAPSLPTGGYFLVAHGFWSEDPPILTTELGQDRKSFNYLITFPVLADTAFLQRTKNQHMLVELWQKTPGVAEKLVGVTRLPLHQFYIAFRDAQLADHLSRAKLPVISIDGWSGIGSPLAADPCGQLQAVLAIGTENQIEYFKLSRGLAHTSGDAPVMGHRPTVPEPEQKSHPVSQVSSSVQTDAPPPSENMVTPSTATSDQRSREQYHPVNTSNSGNQKSEVANMLSAFIENLAQRLPISSERSTAPCYDQNFAEKLTPASPHSQANRPQMRQTSDLLENLQRALAQTSAVALDSGLLTTSTTESAAIAEPSQEKPLPVGDKLFKVCIDIEQAVNLPKLNVSKKYSKRNKNRTPGTGSSAAPGGAQRLEVEPSAYVTFEGYNLQPGTPNTVKSHEGIVYTTAVVENCSNPSWQKKFEVMLPVDLMTNDEKRFILKVWRKAVNNSDLAKCRLLPAPMEDAVVGFTAVDLSVFLNGMPCILGWYNIMDFSGRCNGQIKVNITPQENVTHYKSLDESVNFQIPLSIDVDCVGIDAGNTSLSRALKRKFTELEEITQRLKARLFDVTGDENVDPDDEFERDLNTEADEADDEDWVDPLEDTSGQKRNSQHPNGAAPTMTTNTSSYSMSSERTGNPKRSLTGCSDRSSKQQKAAAAAIDQAVLEKLLQKHDWDTLINPNILKNLLNPSVMSTSESTPVSNPYANLPDSSDSPAGTSADADMSEDSTAAGGDKVKLISSALQRTTISEASGSSCSSSSDPAGENNATKADVNESTEQQQQQNQREAPEGEPMKVNDK
ncbi:C2 domain-containing protein 3 [Sabethes cyaneus]|uniref:C2 domain-containing protein 3 n=1 Tax=Sabethes cyaneus TaxID=53552 RepID=UPI00237DDD34|nr:C2 domain-containing protein 3 [Sabethes cyaneus]